NAEDDEEVECVAAECIRLLWPFMKADYQARSKWSATAIPRTSSGVIKLKARTVGGVFQSGTHDLILIYPPNPPLEYTFPGVPIFSSSDIERLHELKMHIFKIRYNE